MPGRATSQSIEDALPKVTEQADPLRVLRAFKTLAGFFVLCSIVSCLELKLAHSLSTVLFWPSGAVGATLAMHWRLRSSVGRHQMLAGFTLLYCLSEYLAIMAIFHRQAPPHCLIYCATDALYVPLYAVFMRLCIRLTQLFCSYRRTLLLVMPVVLGVITQSLLSSFIINAFLNGRESGFFITNWATEQLATALVVTMVINGLCARGWTSRLRAPDKIALLAIAALAIMQILMGTSQWLTVSSIAIIPCLIAITRLGYLWSILVSGCFILFSSIQHAHFYTLIMPHLTAKLFYAQVFSHRMETAMVAVLSIFMSDLVSQRNRLLRNALRQADIDQLTGLHNRNFVMRRIGQGLARIPTGVVMVDIDHFKQINDTHGHHAGDEVIAAVASQIRQHLRAADIVARWGGEEFLLILPDISLPDLQALCHSLVSLVGRKPLPLGNGSFAVSISAGATHLRPRVSQDVTRAISNAAHLLYEAKRSGRNRVVFDR